MKTAWKVGAAAVVVVAALGAALDAAIHGRNLAERESVAAAGVRRQLEESRGEVESLRRRGADLAREVERLRTGKVMPVPAEPAPAPGPVAAATPAETVESLESAARSALDRKDGAAALAAVRRLAALVPGGRSPAMALVAALDEAREDLEVGDGAWAAFLACPAVTDLLGWSLGRPSPEAFREIAADALPTLVPPETLIPRFREALLTEEDEDVRRSMVEGLIGVDTPASEAVLLELLGDGRMNVPVRVQAATHLSLSDAPETRQALRAAAEGAPAALAAGIRTALGAGESTASGFLVTGFVNGSVENRGLETGDLLLSYDGRAASDGLDAAIRGALERDGFVKVEVLRAGERRTVEVRPGWLGLIGRVVRVPERR